MLPLVVYGVLSHFERARVYLYTLACQKGLASDGERVTHKVFAGVVSHGRVSVGFVEAELDQQRSRSGPVIPVTGPGRVHVDRDLSAIALGKNLRTSRSVARELRGDLKHFVPLRLV
jgi:hypothetical protein